jgi:hypothetical protein
MKLANIGYEFARIVLVGTNRIFGGVTASQIGASNWPAGRLPDLHRARRVFQCSRVPIRFSLIDRPESLFSRIFSLIDFVGNFARNRCSTGISCLPAACLGAVLREFPEKFPVCREFGWRQVRSVLRR